MLTREVMGTGCALVCGSYQLYVLHAACLTRGISPNSIIVLIYAEGGNDQLGGAAVAIAKSCMEFNDAIDLRQELRMGSGKCDTVKSADLRSVLSKFGLVNSGCDFWYSLGNEKVESGVSKIVKPSRRFLYEDGFSCVSKSRRLSRRFLLKRIVKSCLKLHYSQILEDIHWITKICYYLKPSEYWVCDARLWCQYYAHPPERVRKIQKRHLRASFGLSKPLKNERVDVLLITNVYSERGQCSLGDEMLGYTRIIKALVEKNLKCAIKSHPRTSVEKMDLFNNIAGQYNVQLISDSATPVESYLSESNECLILGPPTTALLNAQLLGYGRAICAADGVFANIKGIGSWAERIFNSSGIPVVHDLGSLLREIELNV